MIDVDNSSSFSIDEVNVKKYITQMLKFLKVKTNSPDAAGVIKSIVQKRTRRNMPNS